MRHRTVRRTVGAALLALAAASLPAAAADGSAAAPPAENGAHRLLSEIRLGPVGSWPEAWIAPGESLAGRAIRVPDFRVEVPRPRADLDSDLKWRDAATVFADTLIHEAGPKLAPAGIRFGRNEGKAVLEGAVTRLVLPRRAAGWDGWVGHPSGEGEVEIELLVRSAEGKPLAAIRHRFAIPSAGSVLEVVRLAMRKEVASFLLKAASGS